MGGIWRFLDNLLKQVREAEPEVVVLLSEALFRPLSEAGGRELHDRLMQISDEIYPVAFIRQFPSYFLSLVQQRIVSQGRLPAMPEADEVMGALAVYESLFGSEALRLFPYEHDRDVVSDFCTLLSGTGVARSELGELPERPNKSLSSAAMAVLMEYKRAPPQRDAKLAAKNGNLLGHRLKELDSELEMPRPELRPDVESVLIPRGRDLERQLRDRYGLRFTVSPLFDHTQEENYVGATLPPKQDVKLGTLWI